MENGRYDEHLFRDAEEDENQEIKFCVVGAHEKNGITDSNISILILLVGTFLFHAQRNWPETIKLCYGSLLFGCCRTQKST